VVVNQCSLMGRPGGVDVIGVDVIGRLEDWSFVDISSEIGRGASWS